MPLMCRYGLPVPSKALIAASATAASMSALVASPGLAVWIAASTSPSAAATAALSKRSTVPVAAPAAAAEGESGGDRGASRSGVVRGPLGDQADPVDPRRACLDHALLGVFVRLR